MQRRRHQRCVAAGLGKRHQILLPTNAAAGRERQLRHGRADIVDQAQVQARFPADARQIDDDHRAHSGVRRLRGQHGGRLARAAERIGCQRAAVAQVEAERHTAASDGRADCREGAERRQGFEADNHVGRAKFDQTSRPVGRGDARVHPRRRVQHGQRRDARVLNAAAGDRVQIGDVQFAHAERSGVRARQGQRVARLDGRCADAFNGSKALPVAS